MGQQPFEVDPVALRELAAVFEKQADRLARAVPEFRDTSYAVNDAFGKLGPSTEALQAFLELAQEDSSELTKLSGFLESNAAALRTAADNYEKADAHSRVSGAGGAGP